MKTRLLSPLDLFLDIIVLSMWLISPPPTDKGANVFILLGLFGLPVDFHFLNAYDILKNDGLIILLSVGFSLSYNDINV